MTRQEAEQIVRTRMTGLFADEPEISIEVNFKNDDEDHFYFTVFLFVDGERDDFESVKVEKSSGNILPDFQLE